MKEIDWEERHFQICLALIQGEATKPDTRSFPYNSIIARADKMIEVLKKRVEKKEAAGKIKAEKNTNKNLRTPSWSKGMIANEHGLGEQEGKKYFDIWEALQHSEYGFEKGSDIPFSLFSEACEGICDVNDIDTEKFSEMFDVYIG